MISHGELADKALSLQVSALCEVKNQHVLENRLRESLHQPVDKIHLNFSNVRCISSSAMSILFHRLRKYYPDNVEIVVDSPPDYIRELLELTRLDERLTH